MKLPAPDEYRDAMQNPRLAFADPDLKFAKCEKDHWDLPRIMTGGFAAIFHLHKGKSQWAVRCFYKDVPELRRRYDAIGQFLSKRPDGVFVDASLLHDGILVQGQRYPIIKMAWIDGYPLNLYIESNISKRQAISWLPDAFLELTERLEKLGIAHGDLQHGNIMVTDHSLKLIDYDGIFLPELKGLPNNQQGHPNYQLPSRADEYGPEIDRFSEVVIYTALKAVVESPSLWKKYSNGENLLFKQDDFVDPDSSELMSDLERVSDLGPLVPKLRVLCALGIEDAPALEDFLSGRWRPPALIPPPIKVAPRPLRPLFEVLEASDTAALLARIGHRVTVVGQIISIREDVTRYGQPYAFLNFGDWRRDFYLVAWSGALGLFTAEGLKISSYKGKWISITGIVSSYKNRPQIEVEMSSQIEILPGMHEATARVRGIMSPSLPVARQSTKRRPKAMSPNMPSPNPARMQSLQLIKPDILDYAVAQGSRSFHASDVSSQFGLSTNEAIYVLHELIGDGHIRYSWDTDTYAVPASTRTPSPKTIGQKIATVPTSKTLPPTPISVAQQQAVKKRILDHLQAHRGQRLQASDIAAHFGISRDMALTILEELTDEGKIRRVAQTIVSQPTTAPPVPTPTTQVSYIPNVDPQTMTQQDAQTLGRLYNTYQPSPPSHAPPSQSRPTISPRASQTIPSPGLFAGGVLLILTAIAVAAIRIYLLSLFLVIIGLPVAYYALTHHSTLVPVQVMSYTSTNARFVGRCKGCGRLIQKRSAIVKTDRGWMHLQCTSSAKKRVWRRA
jgi:hypothetical protein